MATRITRSFKLRRMASVCSLRQRRRRFAFPSSGRAGRRERPEPTSTTSCAYAGRPTSAFRKGREPSRPWRTGAFLDRPAQTGDGVEFRQFRGVRTEGHIERHVLERHVLGIRDRATEQRLRNRRSSLHRNSPAEDTQGNNIYNYSIGLAFIPNLRPGGRQKMKSDPLADQDSAAAWSHPTVAESLDVSPTV